MKHSTFHAITTNTFYQALGKGVSIIFSLITIALLTRHLGQAGYGQYTLITTIILLFNSFTEFGTTSIAVRAASQQKYPQPQIYGNMLIIRLMTSLLGALIMISIGIFKFIDLPFPMIFIGSLALLSLALRSSMQVIFQVKLKFQYSAIAEVVSSSTLLIATYWAISQTVITPQSVTLYLLISGTISSLVALVFGYRLSSFKLKINPTLIKYILREAVPLGTIMIVYSIYNRFDTFFLQHFHGDEAVGLYGLAYKIHDNLIMVAAFFMNAMFPLLSQSKSSDKKNTQHLFSTSFHFILAAGIFVFLFFTILARPIILLLSGAEYLAAADILRILLLATFVSYLNHVVGYTYTALGLQSKYLIIAVISLIINLSLNYTFIPIYSFYAAAFITFITELVTFTCSLTYIVKTQRLTPRLRLLPTTFRNLIINRQQLF